MSFWGFFITPFWPFSSMPPRNCINTQIQCKQIPFLSTNPSSSFSVCSWKCSNCFSPLGHVLKCREHREGFHSFFESIFATKKRKKMRKFVAQQLELKFWLADIFRHWRLTWGSSSRKIRAWLFFFVKNHIHYCCTHILLSAPEILTTMHHHCVGQLFSHRFWIFLEWVGKRNLLHICSLPGAHPGLSCCRGRLFVMCGFCIVVGIEIYLWEVVSSNLGHQTEYQKIH